jgi:hypothetical protein
VALVLSLPTLRQALGGDATVATAALRFGLALVVAGAAVQLLRTVVPAVPPVLADVPGAGDDGDTGGGSDEPAAPPAPRRRAEDLVEPAPLDEAPAQAA